MICFRQSFSLDTTSPFGRLVADYLRDHTLLAESRRKFSAECAEFAVWLAGRHGRAAAVEDLTRAGLHEWMDSLTAAGLAGSTVNSKRSSLVALANYAAECGRVPALKKVKKMVVGLDPPDSWSREEYAALLSACARVPGDWHGVPAWLCWEMGVRMVTEACARFSELWLARVEDVDLAARTWLSRAVNRKGKRRGLRHQLSEHTCELIARSLDQSQWLESPRDRLWPFPFRKECQWVHLKKILESAGLSATSRDAWHKLRRTGESFLAAEVGVELAAAYAGHTPEVARRHYIDTCRGNERSLADLIAERLEPAGPPGLRVVG